MSGRGVSPREELFSLACDFVARRGVDGEPGLAMLELEFSLPLVGVARGLRGVAAALSFMGFFSNTIDEAMLEDLRMTREGEGRVDFQ